MNECEFLTFKLFNFKCLLLTHLGSSFLAINYYSFVVKTSDK